MIESQYATDPEGEVTFFVERIQGTQGTVDVEWELEPAGRFDLSPTSGTLTFTDVSEHFPFCFKSARTLDIKLIYLCFSSIWITLTL